MPAVLRNYQPVTAERLKNPEDGNWLSIRRTYDGWGYSPLTQITAANVKGLKPVWVFSTGETKVHEAAPLVNNGVMFVSTPNNQVIALDVRTGQPALAISQTTPGRRSGRARYQPRRRALRRQGLFRRGRSGAGRARCEDRQGSLDHAGGGQQRRILHFARSADRGRQSDGGSIGRRVRHSRLRGRIRSGYRQRAVAHDTPFPRPANRAARRGPRAATNGRPAAARCGSPAITIPRPTSLTGGPATAGHGWATSAPATIFTPLRRSRSTSRPARSRDISSTIRTSRGTGTKSRRRYWSTSSATAAPSKD